MAFHVPNTHRLKTGPLGSDDSIGNNGAFQLMYMTYRLKVIASDGEGWEHVSVSIHGSKGPPGWKMMCFIKDLFWDEEDVVMQLHPKKSEYVNHHPGCLHLWRPINQTIPTPPTVLVGPL